MGVTQIVAREQNGGGFVGVAEPPGTGQGRWLVSGLESV
ncbi:MAG: hypothetical protein JWR26_3278 [Pedosphaera sp.]|nr:hypothetical protein [Pedosphaera sp.]